MAASSQRIWLAWNGWHMRVPEDWRALRVFGDGVRGHIVVGDAATAVLQVKWWRRKARRFDAQRWMADRARAMRGEIVPLGGSSPTGFSQTAWLPEARGKNGRPRPIWYGYAPGPRTLVEIVVNAALEKHVLERLAPRVLATLGASGEGEPLRWSIFGASFATPPELTLRRVRMHLGDIVLDLEGGGKRLLVRQIYPAATALTRLAMDKWLLRPEFKEHRVFHSDGAPREWQVDLGEQRRAEGLLQEGRKALGWPLGFVRPRQCARAVVRDESIDRLLIAKSDVAGAAPDVGMVQEALAGMNWALEDENG